MGATGMNDTVRGNDLILDRFVTFFQVNTDKWESEHFSICNELVHYTISEQNYSIKEICNNIVDTLKIPRKLLEDQHDIFIPSVAEPDPNKKEIYVLKRYSFVNGVSTNIISTSTSIRELAEVAETDLFSHIIKNCKDKHDLELINAMISIITTIDKIIYFKTYDDNELYDYIKLREFICNFMWQYIMPTDYKPLSIINSILNFLSRDRKGKMEHDRAKEIGKRLTILLLIETQMEKKTGVHTDIPSLLSEALKTINFLK